MAITKKDASNQADPDNKAVTPANAEDLVATKPS
jgi:hypothetical protein